MNVQKKNNEKGFTIIEVVLVLAIAALIFLMVFIALPALQRSQRDTQRKNDMSRVLTAIQNYQSNNRNALPDDSTLTTGDFTNKYLKVGGDSFTDPNGTDYVFTTSAVPSSFTGNGAVTFTKHAVCDGESLKTSQGGQKIAFQYKLEGGGVDCVSN
jgi:prepilin-type N-terminal cleavage/methylation domain-containing protein